MTQWLFRRGELARDGWQTVVGPAIGGWQYTGLRVAELLDGDQRVLDADATERLIIPLAGSFHVDYVEGERQDSVDLVGRASVFDGPPDVLYLPTGTSAVLSGVGRVAVAEAPTTTYHPVTYLPRSATPIELRGAGAVSRQVHNYGTPSSLVAAKMIVCEVITPAGNWSSYPPHKHDTHIPGVESRLEEIYYFETDVARGTDRTADADPVGMFAAYASDDREIKISGMVRTGDVALVPYGYHGPAAAAPGYDMYYLNVMAGPDAERVWNISDDPAHAWVRSQWAAQDVDPRLPYGQLRDGQRKMEQR